MGDEKQGAGSARPLRLHSELFRSAVFLDEQTSQASIDENAYQPANFTAPVNPE